ncbi:MAG: hypothetical protein ABIK98_04850 [Pseudomonadota bacterium]
MVVHQCPRINLRLKITGQTRQPIDKVASVFIIINDLIALNPPDNVIWCRVPGASRRALRGIDHSASVLKPVFTLA